MRTDAVPAHFKRNAFAHSWLQPVCIQSAPTSLIQVHSQSQLLFILHLSQPCSWPSSFSQVSLLFV